MLPGRVNPFGAPNGTVGLSAPVGSGRWIALKPVAHLCGCVQWDLSDILASLDDAHTEPVFEQLEALTGEIEEVKPRLDKLSREDVAEVLDRLGQMRETARRLSYRGHLAFATDTTDDEAKTFMERAQLAATQASHRVRFLTHWIKGLDEEQAERITPADPELAYYVATLRKFSPYMLSEEIEEIIADKDMAGVSAVGEAREIHTSSLRFTDPKTGDEVTQSEITRRVYDPDPEIRRQAYAEVFRVYEANAPLLSHIYRSIVRDWNLENLKHRGYPRAMTPMNMGNEVSDEVVTTVLDVCRDRRSVWQDYFAWKADHLGEPFDRRDIYAPLDAESVEIPFDEARETVLAVHEGFHETFAACTREVFEAQHVDAFPRPNKRGGAFCATPQTDMTPYVLLNHTDDARSVSTMAHELGHAVHSMLAAERRPLVSSAPLPLAETASVFSELLLHHHLIDVHPEAAVAITAERVADLYATIQRQAYFARFEIAAHELIPEGQPTAALDEAYMDLLTEQFGDLDVPDVFAKEWMLIPHFNAAPFYVSSYSFGALMSLALYHRYDQDPSFADNVIAILSAGGSRDPAELLAEHGIDITDASFWSGGIDVVEGMVETLSA